MKKVSIIVPIHNSEKHLKECIDSIINQTYKNLEIILVNDGSIDNSLSIIKSYDDKRIKIIDLKENEGVSIARNKGVDISTGDLICFIDSDDYWNKKKIEKQVKFIKNKAFIYSDYEYLKKGKRKRVNVPKSITYEEALKNTTIFTSTVMFNMNKLNKEDLYMPKTNRGQDTSTWWKILKKIGVAYGMNEVLSVYRVGEPSLSSNKLKAICGTWEIYKFENLEFYKKLYYFICYIINAVKRRI